MRCLWTNPTPEIRAVFYTGSNPGEEYKEALNRIPLLAEDDPLFRAGVMTSGGFPFKRLKALYVLGYQHFRDPGKGFAWALSFLRTIKEDPDRFHRLDTSRCSSCRWAPICQLPSRTAQCSNFIGQDVPDWSIQAIVSFQLRGESWRYDWGFWWKTGLALFKSDVPGRTADSVVNTGSFAEFLRHLSDVLKEHPGARAVLLTLTDREAMDTTATIMRVRPRRNEEYSQYCDRVHSAIESVIRKRDSEEEELYKGLSQEEISDLRLRRLIKGLGLSSVLEDSYGGDAAYMADDYWPNVDIEMLLKDGENVGKEKITPRDLYKEVKEEICH